MTGIEYFIAILFCLILSAFFSSSETALLRLKPQDLEADVQSSRAPAVHTAKSLIRSTSSLLVTILCGNNIVNIFGAACASSLATLMFGPKLGLFISTFVMTVLVLVFSEIVPKAVAARNPKKVAYFVSMPLYLVHKASFPVHWVFNAFLDPWISRLVGASEQGDDQISSEDLLREASKIREDKRDGSPLSIIGSTARAAELLASDIIIPRAKVFSCPISDTPQDIFTKMLGERFSRVPIYDDSIDRILGVVHFRDLVKLMDQNPEESSVKSILKPVIRVPERTPILSILSKMQKSSIHMSIVKDEFGGTLGIITHEDILEELVGEIRDEFDSVELNSVKKVSDDIYDADADLLVHDFVKESGWELIFERGDTLGALLMNSLGKIPKRGEIFENSDYRIVAIEMDGNRLTRVRVEKLVQQSEDS